jgi:mono/diheme cytochrome c family protein
MRKIVFVMLAGMLILAACGGGNESSANANEDAPLAPVPAEYAGSANPFGADAADEGAEIFRTNCEMCHGPQGHGDGPAGQALDPKPRDLSKLQAEAGDDFLFWRISEGKPGTSMVAFKGILSEDQIWQVVSFIRTLK